MKTLITDASYLHTLAIVRYIGKENIEPFVLGSSKKLPVSVYSRYCKGYFNGPDPKNEKKYIEFILKILAMEKFDNLIPVSYIATQIASKYKNEINQISKVEVNDYDKVKIALNKRTTYELAEKIGVPYPKTFYPKSIKEVEIIKEKVSYPAVIKGIFEVGGNIVVVVKDKNELEKKYSEICQDHNPSTQFLPIIQEFIQADQDQVYCLSALYQNGRCKRIFMQRQLRNTPVKGGTAAYAESFYSQEIKDYSLKLLDNLKWHGVAHLEFKLDRKYNLFKLMEINPKFWASTDMALRAGINFPYLLCQISQGSKLEYSEEYNRDLKFHFPFSRELKHIIEKPASIFKITMDTLNPSVKSNIWLSDLKPNLIELLKCLGSIIIPVRIMSIIKYSMNKKNAK
jgi:predicted ATP-grasp superfamily ATP-dependent carboligase